MTDPEALYEATEAIEEALQMFEEECKDPEVRESVAHIRRFRDDALEAALRYAD